MRIINYLQLFFFVFLSNVLYAQVCNFSVQGNTSGCLPGFFVRFVNNSTGSFVSTDWNITGPGLPAGGVNILDNNNPQYTFTTAGCFNVTIRLKNAVGPNGATLCTLTRNSYICVYAPPSANFGSNATVGCAPFNVNFTCNTTAGTGAITTCEWDFGDGSSSAITNGCQAATHTFTTPGKYRVLLTCRDANGCSDTESKADYITVLPQPNVSFTGVDNVGCTVPQLVGFNSSVTPATTSGNIRYLWDFGDPTSGANNSSTLSSPTHTYNNTGTYGVRLIVDDIGGAGCRDTAFIPDFVALQNIVANFSSPTSACTGNPIQFTNLSTASASTFAWDFGDGTTSNLENPVHSYAAAGCYTVVFTASNPECSNTYTFNCIQVNEAPTAGWVVDANVSCKVPTVVSFTSTSIGVASVRWLFSGNGVAPSNSSINNPAVTYTQFGNYDVTLIATAANGCSDTVSIPGYVVIRKPTVTLAADRERGCVPHTVTFSDTLNSIPGDTIVSWNWNFSDPPTSNTGPGAIHTFNSIGQYTVGLHVVTAMGCVADTVIPNYITVSNKPNAAFVADPLEVCIHGDLVNFTDQSTVPFPGAIDEWFWDVGEGNYTTQNCNHQYVEDTICYPITLVVGNMGCYDTMVRPNYVCVLPPLARFRVIQNCADPYTVRFEDQSGSSDSLVWNFGDGSPLVTGRTGLTRNITHTYPLVSANYTVTLTVFNFTNGCWDDFTMVVRIREAIARYTIDTTRGCVPLQIHPVNNSQDAAACRWTAPGGIIDDATSCTPTITYNTPGTFNINTQLIVADILGCSDTLDINEIIEVSGVTAAYTVAPPTGCAPLNVTFTDAGSSTILGGPLTTWTWNSGDGVNIVSGPATSTTFTYPLPNVNTPILTSLTVINAWGCQGATNLSVLPTFPFPIFVATPDTVCKNQPVSFINSSTGLQLSYLWDFGDGTTSQSISPVHSYTRGGSYRACLSVTDVNRCVSTVCDTILVSDLQALFTQDTTFTTCPPLRVNYTNSSVSTVGISTCRWTFGDGGTSALCNSAYTYTRSGYYDVGLIVTDALGCKDTIAKDSLIFIGGPRGDFSFTPNRGCVPLDVTFTLNVVEADTTILVPGDGGTVPTILTLGGVDTVSIRYTYTVGSVFQPTLFLTDENNCNLVISANDSIVTASLQTFFTEDRNKLCEPGNIIFNDSLVTSDPATVTWIFEAGSPPTSPSNDPTIFYSTPGIYDVTLIAANSLCRDTIYRPDEITVAAKPTMEFSYRLDDPCIPNRVRFSNTTTVRFGQVVTWEWDFGDGTPTVNAQNPLHVFPATPQGVPVRIYNVRLVAISNFNCSDTLIIPVKIYPFLIPVVTPSDTLICPQSCVRVSVFGGNSVRWQPTNSVSDPTSPNPTICPLETTVYQIIVSDSLGCQKLDTATIRVSTTVAVAGEDRKTCDGESVQLNGSAIGAVSTTWTPPLGLSNPSVLNPLASPPRTTVYTLTAIDPIGCTTRDSMVLLVGNRPNLNITPDTTICQRQITQINVVATGANPPYTYQWIGNTQGLSCNNCANPFLRTDMSSTSGIYTVIVTDEDGCTDTVSTNVTVRPIPAYSLTANDTLCPREAVQLSTSNSVNCYWNPVNGLSDPNICNPIARPSRTTMYTIDMTFANGCRTRDTVTLTVIDHRSVDAGPNSEMCLGDSVQLKGTSSGGSSVVNWTPSASLSNSTIFEPYARPSATTTYYMTVDTLGCRITDSTKVTVLEKTPLKTFDYIICLGDSVRLNATGADSYSWSPPTGLSSTNISNPYAKPTVTTDYIVTGIKNNCPPTTDTATVTVNPLPEIVISSDRRTFQLGETIQLNTVGIQAGYSYSWSPASFLSCTDCPDPLVQPETNITYTLSVRNQFGCVSESSIELLLVDGCEKLMVIPNAFSPNGDGVNDIFRPRGIASIQMFRVFNRWGELLFESNNINKGWDGTYKGQLVDNGVYVYYIETKCTSTGQTILKKGNVTVIK